MYSTKSGYPSILVLFMILCIAASANSETGKAYVGSDACSECHTDEYESFLKHADKAHSYESVTLMRKGLTDSEYKDCLKCHSTGYGQPGGFVSESDTPHLRNAGCEVCHGPGSVHVDTENPEDITADVTVDVCTTCHIAERVDQFKYKPILHGGAH